MIMSSWPKNTHCQGRKPCNESERTLWNSFLNFEAKPSHSCAERVSEFLRVCPSPVLVLNLEDGVKTKAPVVYCAETGSEAPAIEEIRTKGGEKLRKTFPTALGYVESIDGGRGEGEGEGEEKGRFWRENWCVLFRVVWKPLAH